MRSPAVRVRQLPGAQYTEFYLVAHLTAPATRRDVARLAARARLAGAAHLLKVVVLGAAEIDPAEAAEAGYVVANHQHPPAGETASVEVYGIAAVPGADLTVTRFAPGGRLVVSREPAGEVRRLVYAVGPAPGSSVLEQALSGLDAVGRALVAAGMTPRQLDRTWYYVSDIATTYPELNKARDQTFDRWSLTRYPASTGIGARLPGPALVAIVAEATSVDGAATATPFDTRLQCPPVQYGPRFVRANRLRRNGCRVVNVSGISSIDTSGRSLGGDDPAAHVDHAMASLLDLLTTGGATLADVCSCYVYCTDQDVLASYWHWLARAGVSLPTMVNFVDICRPELRFEIEARAVVRC